MVEDHIDDVVALFSLAVRVETPPRVSFRTNASAYHKAYWLDVSLQAEGAYGAVDVSFDAAQGQLEVHRIDEGVREVRVDLRAIGLENALRTVRIDAPTAAPMVLLGATSDFPTRPLERGDYPVRMGRREDH
ncbi:MAG: hypothetical protein NVS3B20_24350 [Polyangiales bacterium]